MSARRFADLNVVDEDLETPRQPTPAQRRERPELLASVHESFVAIDEIGADAGPRDGLDAGMLGTINGPVRHEHERGADAS
ncbi:hypothetical protein NKG05_23265 [Oerskovia sp. M15]